MMLWLFPAALACAIGVPHLLRLDRCEPVTAAAIWLAALALRALAAAYVALWLVFFLPATAVFDMLTHWCWHTVLPVLATHLGLDGHRFGDAATIAPSFVLAASAVSVAFGLTRAARAVRALVQRAALGTGPQDSLIVGGAEVVVAAAGIRRPRIVVSAGALVQLDDEELAASIDHERGHISRRHRFAVVFAELCRGLGRFLPGTAHARRELIFHLERDADRWSVARRNDPIALASAICKAALPRPRAGLGITALAGGHVTSRVSQLLDCDRTAGRYLARVRLRALALGLTLTVLALAALLPATMIAGNEVIASSAIVRHCPD